jgi:hypothetical protein
MESDGSSGGFALLESIMGTGIGSIPSTKVPVKGHKVMLSHAERFGLTKISSLSDKFLLLIPGCGFA